MLFMIFYIWMYLVFDSTICLEINSRPPKRFKDFKLSFESLTDKVVATPSAQVDVFENRLSSKCSIICTNDVNSTIVVQTATNNWTNVNIPVKDDIMAIVYYQCGKNVTRGGPKQYEYHTFQKLCGNKTEECKKFTNSFESQWSSLKTGLKPSLSVTFVLPDNVNTISIKTEKCIKKDPIIFTFKINNKSIDYRKDFNRYNYTENVFVARDLNQLPITLAIMKFNVEDLADVVFNIKREKVMNCSNINKDYCSHLCKNNESKFGGQCFLEVDGKQVEIAHLENQCPMINIFFKFEKFYGGSCDFFKLQNMRLCEYACVDLPYCSYMCIRNGTDINELGYLENTIFKTRERIGSSHWTPGKIPDKMVFLNECSYSKDLCKTLNTCSDEPVGYSCPNNDYNLDECNKLKKQRYWICPTVKINESNNTNANESISMKYQLFENNLNTILYKKVVLKEKLIGMFRIMSDAFNQSEKKEVYSYFFQRFEKAYLQLTSQELKANHSIRINTDKYDAYGCYLNETANEYTIPLSEDKVAGEEQFVKLRINNQVKGRSNRKLLASFLRYKGMDPMNDTSNIRTKSEKQSLIFIDNETYKNSDMISLSITEKRNITVHFKLKTFEKVKSVSWLYSFEDECGFLDEHNDGRWSTMGCRKIALQADQFYCECDHLSNFAMLFSIKMVNLNHLVVWQYMSLVGGVINCISLMLFLIFVLFINSREKLRLDQLNIALCLMLGTFVFLMGYVTSKNRTVCKLAALSAQFLFLSAFVWKLILGINVVRMIASLRYQNEDWMIKYRLATIGVGYGLPLLIVSVSGGVFWESYTMVSKDVCWIQNTSHAFLTFLIPVGIIIAVNLIALFFIANTLIRNFINTRKTKINESNEIMVFLQLMISMGLTWIPSYFATIYLTAMYLMLIFFPLQGLLMFLFVVVINRENREKVSAFVVQKYSSLISKSTTNTDTKSHSKSKSTSDSKNTEQLQSLLSEQDKEKNRKDSQIPMVTITNEDDVSDLHPMC